MADATDADQFPTTPDGADLNQRVLNLVITSQDRLHKMVRRWLIAGLLVVALGVGYVAATAHQIRTTQITNTNRSNCQDTAFNRAFGDLNLAFHKAKTGYDFQVTKC